MPLTPAEKQRNYRKRLKEKRRLEAKIVPSQNIIEENKKLYLDFKEWLWLGFEEEPFYDYNIDYSREQLVEAYLSAKEAFYEGKKTLPLKHGISRFKLLEESRGWLCMGCSESPMGFENSCPICGLKRKEVV